MTHITDEGGKLVELAKRCEEAATEEQGDLLDLAYRVLHPWPDKNYDFSAFNRFQAMLKAGAYESAALMLVPEGLFPTFDFVAKRCWLRTEQGFDVAHGPAFGRGNTVSLALCAAALRAAKGEG